MRADVSHTHGSRRSVAARGCIGLLVALALHLTAQPCAAYDVLLRWTVPPASNVAGYHVHVGSRSGVYAQNVDVGGLGGSTLAGVVYYLYSGVPLASPLYFAVTAYNSAGVESDDSNEKVFNNAAVTVPLVDAGPNQTALLGTSVTLGSSAQPGLIYFWEQTGGPPATLSNRTSSSTLCSAATTGTFTFAETAYNAQGVAARQTVTVTLIAGGAPTATPTRTPTTVITGGGPTATPTRSPTRNPGHEGTRSPTLSASRTPTSIPTQGGELMHIRGNRRSPRRDRSGCQVEWVVLNEAPALDRFGLPSQSQACEDGDPSCDFQPDVSGICEFHVMVCLNNADPDLPACIPGGVGSVDILSPRLRPALGQTYNAIMTNDIEALSSGLNHLRDPNDPTAFAVYSPPLGVTQEGFCSAPFAIQAMVSPRRNLPSVTLKTRSTDNSFPRRHIGVSQLQLTCKSAVQ